MNYVYLIPLSLVGFAASFYIYYSKKKDNVIYCLIGHGCDAVVKSKYGKTFGIENTIPGTLYYALIFVYAIIALLNQNVFKDQIVYYLVVSASIASVLFSAYLTGVQAFVLKKWCDYCVASALASLSILIVLII